MLEDTNFLSESLMKDIHGKAEQLDREAKQMRRAHQLSTILTILLGVAAPAFVTYTPPANEIWWKLIAVAVTALGTASATIRTVLRYNERYSNAALTSIALYELEAEILAKWQDILLTIKSEFHRQKSYELEAWAQRQKLSIVKSYIEKDVMAITQDKIELTPLPPAPENQKNDPTRI